MSETFYEWLGKQIRRNSPTGDIARDAQQDDSFPKSGEIFQIYHDHLKRMHADGVVMDALKGAWRNYKQAMRNKQKLIVPGVAERTNTLRGCVSDGLALWRQCKAGPYIELLCRPDTGGAAPGVKAMAHQCIDYALDHDIDAFGWDIREYDTRVRGYSKTKPGRGATASTTTEAERILSSWGYSPDKPCWEST